MPDEPSVSKSGLVVNPVAGATSVATSNSSPLLGFDPTESNGVTMFGWFKVTGTPASIPSILRWSDDQGQSLVLAYTIPSGGGGV